MLKRSYDIVIDVVNGVTEKFIELIQASTGVRELAIKLTDGEDVFNVENKKSSFYSRMTMIKKSLKMLLLTLKHR